MPAIYARASDTDATDLGTGAQTFVDALVERCVVLEAERDEAIKERYEATDQLEQAREQIADLEARFAAASAESA
ncbi:MAG TPA: hypothetical protein VFJ25_09170 [Casimicrobiaceae bacterium]|nr:hypothetical protein [Casimicrobiaceae bacterium]